MYCDVGENMARGGYITNFLLLEWKKDGKFNFFLCVLRVWGNLWILKQWNECKMFKVKDEAHVMFKVLDKEQVINIYGFYGT